MRSKSQRAPVNIQRVLEKTIEILAPSLPTGVSVQTRLRAPSATVSGDATQLHQVVSSLCINAIRAVGISGRVRLDLRALHVGAPRSLPHGELATGHHLRLSIDDNGSGVPGERIGMDLSAAIAIVNELAGAIDVRSEPGLGTRVTVWLPLITPALPATPHGNGEVVLIVDDEPLLVELAVQRLTELGYAALAYTSSRTALQALFDAPAKVDLVLTDENMPELSGSELAAAIRARRLDVPIIMISGNVTAALEERARAAGVSELMSKPLRDVSMAAALARCLRSKARP